MLSTLLNPLPYHILAYGTFLGSQLYQSFINSKMCYRHLPPQNFNNLSKHLYPVYFRGQLGLAVLTLITKPPGAWLQTPAVNDVGNLLLGLVAVIAGLNWYVFGPRTSDAMVEKARVLREAQDEKAGKDIKVEGSQDAAEKDALVARVKKTFSRYHTVTVHLNAIAMAATVLYGFVLGGRLQLQ